MPKPILPCETDPEAFFPLSEREGQVERAVALCSLCPIQAACLRYALDTNQGWGIWGGKTSAERRDLLELAVKQRSLHVADNQGPRITLHREMAQA